MRKSMRSTDEEQNMSALVEGEDFMNLKFNTGGHRSDCFFHGEAGNLMTIAAGHSLLRFESSDRFSGEHVTMPKRQNDPEGQEWEEEEEEEDEDETDDDVEDQDEWDDEDDPEEDDEDDDDDDDWEEEDDWDDEDWNEEEEDWNHNDPEEDEMNDWDESDWN